MEDNKVKNSSHNEEESFEDVYHGVDLVEPEKRINLPKKSQYRTRAHCNPFAEISIEYPISPKAVDWSLHYPLLFGLSEKENLEIRNNTTKYPISYTHDYLPESTSSIPLEYKSNKTVNILDVGCGYGGLLYNMSSSLAAEDLALGMEIRDKVSNFVGEKIKSLRNNSNHTLFNNISVLRTNTMKLLLNHFYKEQLDKIFFCFPDPHFKKVNHRRRIINKYLLNDYAYVLKFGGKLYTITDVEDLHKWHVSSLDSHPCFRRLSEDQIHYDKFLGFMKSTDEAIKVKKVHGPMFWAVYERVSPNIESIEKLIKILS